MIVETEAGLGFGSVLAALHAGSFPPGERWDEDAMRSLLQMPGCFGWIDTREGVAVGLALARVVADESELLTIGVLPEARGRGVAGSMLHSVARHATAAGACRMFLEVANRNLAAAALYRRAGFVQIGRRKRYYPSGEDALVLEAALPLPVGAG